MTPTRTPIARVDAAGRAPWLSVRDAVVPVHPFTGLLSLAQEKGWKLRELFPCFEFDAQGQPAPGQRCSYLEAREVVLRAQRLGGRDVAALSGSRKSLANLGVIALGVLAQARLGDAVRFGVEFQLLAGSMLDVALEIDGDEAALVARDRFDDAETRAFLQVDHLVTSVNALAQLPSESFALRRLELAGSHAPELVGQLERALGCPVVTQTEVSRAVMPRDALLAPLKFTDHVTAAFARQACENEIAAMGIATQPRGVRDYLVGGNGELRSPAEMAAEIGISTRTLHRMLAAEGVKYAELVEQIRIERSRVQLLQGRSTGDVAVALGYSDERSFRRAFERWTGVSPARFRSER